MATKDEQAPTETAAPVDEIVATPAAPRANRGLLLGGIIGGGVVAAALLFGGGIAVGVALPDHHPIGMAQAGNPGGPGVHGGNDRPRGDHPQPPRQRGSDDTAEPEGE